MLRRRNQTKTIETTSEALSLANNPDLPPLMNPTMLEASDDLTNLSHLNEPAGMTSVSSGGAALIDLPSPPSHTITVFAEGDIHIQWYCFDSNKSLCSSRFSICSWYGTSICGKAQGDAGSASVCNCGGGLCVSIQHRVRDAFLTSLVICYEVGRTRQLSCRESPVPAKLSARSTSCDILQRENPQINLQ